MEVKPLEEKSSGGFFVGSNIVPERIALARNPQVERADIAQEAIEVLGRNGVAGESTSAFSKDFGTRWRGGEILETDGPVQAAMAIGAAGLEKETAALGDVQCQRSVAQTAIGERGIGCADGVSHPLAQSGECRDFVCATRERDSDLRAIGAGQGEDRRPCRCGKPYRLHAGRLL